MPFDEEEPVKPKIKLKNQNQPSIFDNKPKPQSTEASYKAAAQANATANEYKQKAVDVALRYKKTLEDRTLQKNKTAIANDIENEVIKDLINLAIEINTDETEQEGMGSIGVITLLSKMILLQRDKINTLEYNCSEFNKQLKEINNQLLKLNEKK